MSWQGNSLRPRQNGRHFPDDIFKWILLNENIWILLKISLKFVPKGRINNILALVQIMAWRRPGDKPLSEPLMVSLPTHICVTRPQWVKGLNIVMTLLAQLIIANCESHAVSFISIRQGWVLWNWNVILTTFLSLVAAEVVTSGADNGLNFVNMPSFPYCVHVVWLWLWTGHMCK